MKMKTSKFRLWLQRENQIHFTHEAPVLIQLKVKQRKMDQQYTTGSKTEPGGTPEKFLICPVNRNKKMRNLKQDTDVRLCKIRVAF